MADKEDVIYDDDDPVGWAKDIMFAAQRIGKATPGKIRGRPPKHDVTTCPRGVTERQFDLWKLGREDQGLLMKTLFPRAFTILAAEREKAAVDEIVKQEDKSIEEIEALLDQAVRESQLVG